MTMMKIQYVPSIALAEIIQNQGQVAFSCNYVQKDDREELISLEATRSPAKAHKYIQMHSILTEHY
jgi:hypothetical protein